MSVDPGVPFLFFEITVDIKHADGKRTVATFKGPGEGTVGVISNERYPPILADMPTLIRRTEIDYELKLSADNIKSFTVETKEAEDCEAKPE